MFTKFYFGDMLSGKIFAVTCIKWKMGSDFIIIIIIIIKGIVDSLVHIL